MAVDYASSSSVAEATAANTTYTAPSGITNGDLLLIWHFEFDASAAPPAPAPPAGFATAPGTWPMDDGTGSGDHGQTWLWYKIASGEAGSYTVTHSSCVRRGIMARVSGNDTADPFQPDPTQTLDVTSSTGQTTVFTGLTTSVDGTLILVFAADYNDTANDLTAPTGTTPTFTERVDIGGEYLASGVLATAGATGNKTMTNNNSASNEPFFAVMAAVQPSTGAAPPTLGPAFAPIPFMK